MTLKYTMDDETYTLELLRLGKKLSVSLEDSQYEVIDHGQLDGWRVVEVNGERIKFLEARDGNTVNLWINNRILSVDLVDPRDASGDQGDSVDEIRAPMPGMVITHHKAKGDSVSFGETIVTIESMKLQTNLAAPRDGVIESIILDPGITFEKEAVIVSLVPNESEENDA